MTERPGAQVGPGIAKILLFPLRAPQVDPMASLASVLASGVRLSGTWDGRGVGGSRRALQPAPHAQECFGRINSRRQRHVYAASSTAVTPETTTEAPRWEAFAAGVAGEWDGVTATFDPTGKPQPLPEYYVPQAYQDWGVTLYDWQSQCSCRCDKQGLSYTHRRMMPTVGCEADAIAFTSQQQQLFAAGEPGSAVAADGSYSAGPQNLAAPDTQAAAIEHCLVLEQGQRVRVVHSLRRSGAEGGWRLASIDVHRERWEAPYNGRVELTGCGGGMDPFAETRPLESSALEGQWGVSEGVDFCYDDVGACSEAQASGRTWPLAGGEQPVLLPLGIWASAKLSPENLAVEVGVLRKDGTMRMASRLYEGARLSKACLQTLTKQ